MCSTTTSNGSPNCYTCVWVSGGGCYMSYEWSLRDDRLHCRAKWISNYIHIFSFARGLTTMKNDLRNRNDFRFDFSFHFRLTLPLHCNRNSENNFVDGCATHIHTQTQNSIIHSVSDNFWRSNLIGCHTIFVFICLQQKFWNKYDRVVCFTRRIHGSRRHIGILCQNRRATTAVFGFRDPLLPYMHRNMHRSNIWEILCLKNVRNKLPLMIL